LRAGHLHHVALLGFGFDGRTGGHKSKTPAGLARRRGSGIPDSRVSGPVTSRACLRLLRVLQRPATGARDGRKRTLERICKKA